ncbi:hypothetical protein [Acinetobacter bereziniae]|uniref:hypothetical protein n=1 Tax=Acinetobacter bereziniae TaxID=106648 RepID=UPI00124FBD8E|nr:hypothetical protein [Acinetobacter bereziniae]
MIKIKNMDWFNPIDVHYKNQLVMHQKMADPKNLDPADRALHQKWHKQGGETAVEWEKFKKDERH